MAYQYQEYPRHLYKFGGLVNIVHSDEEKAIALAAGWALQPVTVQPESESEFGYKLHGRYKHKA